MTHTVRLSLFGLLLSSAIALAQEPITVQTGNGPVVGRRTGAVRIFFGIPILVFKYLGEVSCVARLDGCSSHITITMAGPGGAQIAQILHLDRNSSMRQT